MTVDTSAHDDHDITLPLSHPRLLALPAFSDNYIWALVSENGKHCLVVDPGDAGVVRRWLAGSGCALSAILITHHHADHTAGIAALRGPGVTVYGPRLEPIDGVDVRVGAGDVIALESMGMSLDVIDVPGHTLGHVAYTGLLRTAPAIPVLFCGDTLFSAGCGRLFEGTAQGMYASLAQIAELPQETLVCCAHEYTLGNLRFAAAVEPDNPDIRQVTEWAGARRAAGLATLPSSLARERRINPFLRCAEPVVAAAARSNGADSNNPVAVFAALRRWKDGFR